MKHCIIAKFREDGDISRYLPRIREIFSTASTISGVHGARIYENCTSRSNRSDVMIVIDMEQEALGFYDASAMHHAWKNEFGGLLESKAIFDYQ